MKRIISFALSLVIAFSIMQVFDEAAGRESLPTGGAARVLAAESGTEETTAAVTWDSNNWVRILRDYTDYTQVGEYY